MARTFLITTAAALFLLLLTGCTASANTASANDGGSANDVGLKSAGSDASETEHLRPVSFFQAVEDDDERAVALFLEASKVLTHPRCVNCHPAGDRPLQGDRGQLHQPMVSRGADGFGVVGMQCFACHQGENFDPGRVPGAPKWHLAPLEMAWEGRSPAQICAQLKDPARNGDKDLEAIAAHMEEDPLVAWGWNPGVGRAPAPGSQESFSQLIRAWVEAGAACPLETESEAAATAEM